MLSWVSPFNENQELDPIVALYRGHSTGSPAVALLVKRAYHGSSEGHEMLKRNDKCHSIADDVPIPKMYFLSKSVDGLFQKFHFCV